MSDQWCTIESDPGVFTELLQNIGVQGIELIELYDINELHNIVRSTQQILGLVFLFKYDQQLYRDSAETRAVLEEGDELSSNVYFARQMINNACGTQALLNLLMNVDTAQYSNIELGAELNNFKQFTQALDPESRGYTIGSSDLIRTVHNSYARPEPFIFDSEKSKSDDSDDLFHFIGYIPINGLLYELDGLQAGPILAGAYDSDNATSWLDTAKDAIQERINKYASKEIRFNLMALIQSQSVQLQQQIDALQHSTAQIQAKLNNTADTMQTDDNLPTDKAELQSMLTAQQHELHDLQDQLTDEKHKHKQYQTENVRRRHNYVPLIYNLAAELSKRGKLQQLVDIATQKARERAEKQASRKQAERTAPNAPRKTAADTKMGSSESDAAQQQDNTAK